MAIANITINPDCGNSPRKLFLKNFNIAVANEDEKFLVDNIPQDILWEIIGHENLSGKENFLSHLKKLKRWKIKELTIETIITHGSDASVSGEIITANNLKFAFCDIYRFKGASGYTIKKITTFIIGQ